VIFSLDVIEYHSLGSHFAGQIFGSIFLMVFVRQFRSCFSAESAGGFFSFLVRVDFSARLLVSPERAATHFHPRFFFTGSFSRVLAHHGVISVRCLAVLRSGLDFLVLCSSAPASGGVPHSRSSFSRFYFLHVAVFCLLESPCQWMVTCPWLHMGFTHPASTYASCVFC
jgi:hypothetical protein